MPTNGSKGIELGKVEDNITLREKRMLRNITMYSAQSEEGNQNRQQMVNIYFTEMIRRIQENFPKKMTYRIMEKRTPN